ncbi:hypothetical protein B6S44_16660 [Bosea sp. Tri-44]|uniref:serine protease n=1 Tax=Bosea sp. Tri-44 TaxID=1972137 RepID=UPI00100EBBD9|nr:serine protease [Bosea sp. Tri-44]RXT52411.1 hypothetical protein B6S44_16660 [Bosea sp. Tri-44]
MSLQFARALLIGTSLLISAPVSAGECALKSPEHAVFDVVEKPADQKVGTAFVIDADQALFATAYHVLALESGPTAGRKLVLKRGNFEADFERVVSGNNAGLLHEDWAILKARLKEPSLGLHPYPAMHVAYDRPTGTELVGSNVFVTSGAIRQIVGAEWSGADDPVKACDATNVVMLEIPSYDRGFSGSPVFGEQQCGILGLSSRFILPANASSPGLKEAVRAFQQYTKRVDAAAGAKLDLDKLTLEQNHTLLRELVKDKVLVKVVPSRCIVDGVVSESYRNKASSIGRLIRQDYSELVKKLIQVISRVDLDDPESTVMTMAMVKETKLRWVDLLQVVAAFRSVSSEKKLEQKNYFNVFTSAITEKQALLSYRLVDFSYKRAALISQSNEPDIPVMNSFDDTILSLIKENAGVGAIETIRIEEKSLVGTNFSPDRRIALGFELSQVAEKASLPASAREIARKASVSYIASGLADESRNIPDNKKANADLKGEALARLARSLIATTTEESSVVADLQGRVARAALEQQQLSVQGRKLAAEAIANAEATKYSSMPLHPYLTMPPLKFQMLATK